MWQDFEGRHTLPYSRSELTTFSCLVSSPKTVIRYLLSAFICQAHLTRNLYVSLWLLLVDSDQAWILWHTSWDRVETEALLEGNFVCKEYFYVIRKWQTWMAQVSFLYLPYFGPRYTLKRGANNGVSQRSGLHVFPFAINRGRGPWLEGLISPIKSVTILSFMILYHSSHWLAFLETKINLHIEGD